MAFGNTALSEPAIPRDPGTWAELVKLANYRLAELATIRLDRRLTGPLGKEPPLAAAYCTRLAVLASATAEQLLPGIRVAGLRRRMQISTYVSGYGQYAQKLLDTDSALYAFRPEAMVFTLDVHHVTGALEAAEMANEVESRLSGILNSLTEQWTAECGHLA